MGSQKFGCDVKNVNSAKRRNQECKNVPLKVEVKYPWIPDRTSQFLVLFLVTEGRGGQRFFLKIELTQ